jgi:hypothetical protein
MTRVTRAAEIGIGDAKNKPRRHKDTKKFQRFSYKIQGTGRELTFEIGYLQSKIGNRMKTAYELAMERLNKTAPTTKLTGAQKEQLAELDSKYAAKIAGREIALKDEMAKSSAADDAEKVETLRQRWVAERQKLQAELEEEKERVRQGAVT